jgi:hypothetical protein
MNKLILSKLIKELVNLDWFFISGTAVEVYTEGKRTAGDWDIVIKDGDAQVFAKRIGCSVKHRVIKKQNFVVDDYGFETKFNGQDIEITTGYPKERMLNNTFNKLFDIKVKKNYLGVDVFVEPIESLIVQKAMMFRPKDINDLELLKEKQINMQLVKEIANDCKHMNVITNLKKLNYKINE